jgi:hypothetical protein
MEAFSNDVRRVLTQRLPRTADKNHQKIIQNFKNRVESFIKDVIHPLWELETANGVAQPTGGNVDPVAALNLNSDAKGLTLPQIPKLFNVYQQGIAAIANSAIPPFKPLTITEESVTQVVNHFMDLEIEDFYKLGQRFVQDSFVVVSSWYRDIAMNKAVELVYSKFQPFEWVDRLESLNNDLDVVPEDIKDLLQKMQMYLGATG